MAGSRFLLFLPGHVATAFVVLVTTLWTVWGVGEVYYEAWGAYALWPYLMPAAVCLVLSLTALTWPRLGGLLLFVVGGGFTAWWWGMAAARGRLTWEWLAVTLPVSAILIATGILFLVEDRCRCRLRAEGWTPPKAWLRRHLRQGLALACPSLATLVLSIYWLPILLTRVDDGNRGVRRIEGNGVTLFWAPEGPGWSSGRQKNLSWNDIALHGTVRKEPEEDATMNEMRRFCLCRYLSEDGKRLLSEPQDIWRMPTTQEIVRSLGRHGQDSGCTWDGKSIRADCESLPDKETPLWVPSWPPIYYWSAEEHDRTDAYYVSYNGKTISHQPKAWANPRHGFRCVREP